MPLESLLKETRKVRRRLKKLLFFSVLGAVGISVLSCALNINKPGGRIGCLPCSTPLTTYLGEDAANAEGGIAFTCKYGHVDIDHLRNYAEWADDFAKISLDNLRKENTEFEFSGREPVKYYVKISYPSGWEGVEENKKKEVLENGAIELGAYIASKHSIWHETLTWFGWNSTVIISEEPSAFSWEDLPSNMLGCYVATLALMDKEHSFKDAMKITLKQELDRLGIQPRRTNIAAVKSVEGTWYKKHWLDAQMIRRNLDIGTGDNEVSPMIPPGYECGESWSCPVPTLGYLEGQGFKVELGVKPIAKRRETLRIAGENDRIDVEKDFPIIMEYIRRQAVEKGYIVGN